jgi:hypothetical protein
MTLLDALQELQQVVERTFDPRRQPGRSCLGPDRDRSRGGFKGWPRQVCRIVRQESPMRGSCEAAR